MKKNWSNRCLSRREPCWREERREDGRRAGSSAVGVRLADAEQKETGRPSVSPPSNPVESPSDYRLAPQVAQLLRKNRELEQTIGKLKEKVLKIQDRIAGNKDEAGYSLSTVVPFREILQSLISSTHRYLCAELLISSFPSELELAPARQTLISSLESAKASLTRAEADRKLRKSSLKLGVSIDSAFFSLQSSIQAAQLTMESKVGALENRLESLRSRLLQYHLQSFDRKSARVRDYQNRILDLEGNLSRCLQEMSRRERNYSKDSAEMRRNYVRELEKNKKCLENVQEINGLQGKLERKTMAIRENNEEIQKLNEELNGSVREIAKLQRENEALRGKLRGERNRIEEEIEAIFAEMQEIRSSQSCSRQESERWEMTANDLASLFLRSHRNPPSSSSKSTESACDFLSEQHKMTMEDLQSRVGEMEAQIEELQSANYALQKENSQLLLENSMMNRASSPISIEALRCSPAPPSGALLEISQVVGDLRQKWSQELETEQGLRLEIAALQAENWTLREKTALEEPFSSESRLSEIVHSESPATEYDSSGFGRPSDSSSDDCNFNKDRAKTLEAVENIVFSRFPEEKDILEAVKKALLAERRSIETGDLQTTVESRASLEPFLRPQLFDTPRVGGDRETEGNARLWCGSGSGTKLKDSIAELIKTVPKK